MNIIQWMLPGLLPLFGFCVGIPCRNYPIMQKHFENHDIIVQKKEIGPGWVNAFPVLTDSDGKMYVWSFLLGKRWPSSMELMQLLWLWKIQPSKTWDASHDLLIKYVTVLRAFLRRSHTLGIPKMLILTDRQEAATQISDLGGAIPGVFGASP